jgi:NAD(P)-dependent dehydrogenase (short-subunit alcohol dehydrogenase family)
VTDVLQLLRPGLLAGHAVATAGPARPAFTRALGALGAAVTPIETDLADEAATSAAAEAAGRVDALVVDAAALFVAAGEGPGGPGAPAELAPLRAAADLSWSAARAVANAGWLGGDGGKLVLVAPRPGDGPHAEAARDALENMSRTLSIEWSRYGIRITAITPGDATSEDDVTGVVAYLVSEAGDYFSGTRLDLAP